MKDLGKINKFNPPLLTKTIIAFLVIMFFLSTQAMAGDFYSNDQIANAIFRAENSKSHPYGILTHYKTTTPRQACINTIIHAKKNWDGKGDFIEFLGSRYCPIGAKNDPTGLNKNWIKNVKYFLTKEK